ncbi:cytidylate kinase [Tessaracoccus bendigoensis DSM 12906]|uniref:Cytidylate kinase n=1 Tax=Tessaracoccus bendigoensis DSM 12906 TaxID=1123357 RepID=A0A1M6IQQ8_9ACTN|nr:(d)CMP kinase [Tessaracoccus bendigoensis]SHJ36826.1 cytidylate kinase [Tessaracoccus bendigoensis DSM 12906]
MNGSLLFAIDGPSGSGKSTAAKLLARRLGLGYLDTGAMYRAATSEYLARFPDGASQEDVARLVEEADLVCETSPETPRFSINGRDVTEAIREPRISAAVSEVATNHEVRRLLTGRMRELISAHDRRIVVEGRDITTVVAPDADVRVLLVADPDARVARRAAEVEGRATEAEVTDQVLRRDRDDSTVSNFTDAAEGVTVIDSTFLTPDEVVDAIIELVGD